MTHAHSSEHVLTHMGHALFFCHVLDIDALVFIIKHGPGVVELGSIDIDHMISSKLYNILLLARLLFPSKICNLRESFRRVHADRGTRAHNTLVRIVIT